MSLNYYTDCSSEIDHVIDPMYQGIYHGKSYHPPDLDDVLKRSHDSGVTKVKFLNSFLELSSILHIRSLLLQEVFLIVMRL